MENGQEAKKSEEKNDAVAEEVKEEKPADDAEDKPQEKKSEEPSAELLEKIKKQVEYYFGDINMQRDKFLIQQTKLEDGWVPMSIMLNFKMLASMSTDEDVILKALESSDLMEISECRTKIRRSLKHPLPVYDEEYRKAQEARTVYVKGFPLNDTTIEKMKKFFDDFEPYENIVLRKYQDKNKKLMFKGSLFVQFKTLEGAKAFMERESVQYEGKDLIRKWSAEYAQMKEKEKEERRQKKLDGKSDKHNAHPKDDEKSDNVDNEAGTDESLPKGAVIQFSDVSPLITRQDIKAKFGELEASVAYIDFKKGNTKGWIRLQGENSGKTVLEKMKDGKVEVLETYITCRLLEGEEEEQYLAKAKENMANAKQNYDKGKRGKKGRGAQRGRKRKHSPVRDEPSAKKASN